MNSQYKTDAMRTKTFTKQRGIVLFIALIALVVMSLAAVALIRSVDTSVIIAGNLAFKQSATTSADSGLETAATWLKTATAATLNTDNAANAALGYYSTTTTPASLTADATWAAGSSRLATGFGIAAGTDPSGNTIRYIVQRMCNATGAALPANCLYGAPAVGTSSQGVKDATKASGNITPGQSLMFRVTTRVTGPQNTVSYTQAFVY